MRFVLFIAVAAMAALVPHTSFAFDWCYSNPVYRDIDDLQPYIWKAATYYGVEHRKTEQELASAKESAEAIHKKYAATGTITCQGFEGTAQVTVKQNIITTAGHLLSHMDPCNPARAAKGCVFILTDLKGNEQEIKVAELLGTGFKCPAPKNDEDDWAILRLQGAGAKTVDPYLVPFPPGENLTVGSKVSFVGHSLDFQRKDAKGQRKFPKHIQRGCQIKDVKGGFDPVYYDIDCDAGGMSSGGSLLSENSGHLLLAGIFRANKETKEQDKKSFETGIGPTGNYNKMWWKGSAVAVRGEFLKKIIDVTKKK